MVLKIINIVKKYKNKKAVNNISFNVQQGQIIGLLGPNGAGKTTSFNITAGIIKCDSGNIIMGNKNITNFPLYKRSKLGIGYLPQETSIFREMSVENNIKCILEFFFLSKKEINIKLDQLIDEFSLNDIRKTKAKLLSGGEKRRCEIARCLATNPKFILLDEPFAGVDPIAIEDIQKIIIDLKNKNIGILITDHNVQQTLKITDNTYIIVKGEVLCEGESTKIFHNKVARKLYLGNDIII